MAETKGRDGSLEVDDGGGLDEVGELTDITHSWSIEVIDKTDFDSAGNKEVDYGERQLTISGTCYLDEADAGQDALKAAIEGGTTLDFRYRPNVGVGQKEYEGTCIVSSFEITNSRNAMVEATFELQSSGAVTNGTQ